MLTRIWRKGNLHTLLVGMYIGTAIMKNYLKKTKNKTTIWSAILLLSYISGKSENTDSKDIYTPVFVTVFFTIAILWKQLSSVQFSSVASSTLRPHESQYTRPPCPSPTPGV